MGSPVISGGGPAPSVTVAVLTFRRPDTLAALLPLLQAQCAEVVEGGLARSASVVVVDNDPDAGATDVVARAESTIRYVHEPEPGIAAARNRALAAADTDLLAYIDDDERPQGEWLAHLVTTWGVTGAALIAGRVVPEYAAPPTPWLAAGRFFVRRSMPTATPIEAAAAGNLLLDVRQVDQLGVRFDPRFGLTGAEDTMFSRTLRAAGGKLVWCDESVVIDQVPLDRLTRRWVLHRALSHGNASAMVDLALVDTAVTRAAARARNLVGGIARVGGGSARWVLGRVSGDLTHQARGARAGWRGAGMAVGALGLAYTEYARDGRRLRRAPSVELPSAVEPVETTPRTVVVAHPSADRYGADLQLLQSVSAIRAAGWRVVVAVPGDGPLLADLRALGAEIVDFPVPVVQRAHANPLGLIRLGREAAEAQGRMRDLLRRTEADAVYVNTVTLPWWLLGARLAGGPALCHVHEAEPDESRAVRSALYGPLTLARRVVVISELAAATVRTSVPPVGDRMRLIYNGVPGPKADPTPVRPHEGATRLAQISRLSPRKGNDIALEALARLVERGHDVTLDVYGTPFEGYEWFEGQLHERAAEADLIGRVTFHGYTSDVWAALEEADIALAPSLREPFGNTVVEAQLACRPVVAAAFGGHLESVTDGVTGLHSRPGDVDDLAQAIERLLTDPDLAQEISAAGRREAVRRFSPARYGDEILTVLNELVTSTRRSTR